MDPLTNCARKGQPYPSHEAAAEALSLWRWQAKRGYCNPIVGQPRVYACDAPGSKHWHLGRLGGQRNTRHGRRRVPSRKARRRQRRRLERR